MALQRKVMPMEVLNSYADLTILRCNLRCGVADCYHAYSAFASVVWLRKHCCDDKDHQAGSEAYKVLPQAAQNATQT